MSNTDGTDSPGPPAAAAPAKTFGQKLPRWVSAIVGVIFIVIGLTKLYNVFVPSLPGCAADLTNTIIHNIFKDKNLELTGLSNFKTITDTSTEKTCQADFTTPAEAGTLSYQITWQGSSEQVRITNVDTHPR
jgi:hypothetical protein